jgi:hypothetical protein
MRAIDETLEHPVRLASKASRGGEWPRQAGLGESTMGAARQAWLGQERKAQHGAAGESRYGEVW